MSYRTNDRSRRRLADEAMNLVMGIGFLSLLLLALH